MYNGVDKGRSTYNHYDYDNNQFTVVQNGRFYLKLFLDGNPWPSNPNLSKNGTALQYVPWGNIQLGVDSVNISSVQYTDSANYTISCSNSMGVGRFSFRLNVVGKGLCVC